MLLKIEEQTGVKPAGLANRPKLSVVETWYYQEFQELSRDRGYTEGGPLPLSTFQIHTYFRAFELDDFSNFFRVMRLIDDIWLELVTEKRNRESKAPATTKQSAPIPRNKR